MLSVTQGELVHCFESIPGSVALYRRTYVSGYVFLDGRSRSAWVRIQASGVYDKSKAEVSFIGV